MNKLLKRISRIVEYPGVLKAKLYGINPTIASYFFTVKEFYPQLSMIIDVGSNKGDFIKARDYFYPETEVIAFEPMKEFVEVCSKYQNTKVYNIGLWDKDEERVFNENKVFGAVSSFKKRTKEHEEKYDIPLDEREVKINAKRFDSLNIEIKQPCFLKIDVEGSEYEVLEGFADKLKEIDIIQLEYHFENAYGNQAKLSEIISILEKYGFRSFIQKANQIIGNEILHCDLIFFKERKEVKVNG